MYYQEQSDTPFASSRCRPKAAAELLIAEGANMNLADDTGISPLYLAAKEQAGSCEPSACQWSRSVAEGHALGADSPPQCSGKRES
jgi:ankyrin repeat protein